MKRQYYRVAYCDVCRRPFRTARRHARYCSPACRKKASRAGRDEKDKSVTHVTLYQLDMLVKKHADKLGTP